MAKTGVIIHGCNLQAENWRHVAWGDPPHQTGRIPQGVLAARQFEAEVIVLGTGASRKAFQFGPETIDDRPLLECEYSMKYLQQYFDDLAQFDVIQQQLGAAGSESFEAAKQIILDQIVLDREAKNTEEEIENACELFLERGIRQVVLVSSPSHIVRCLRDAAGLFATDKRFAEYRSRLLAVTSVTCYEGSTPDDVVVIEPPHRPDRHVLPTHRRIQRMLDLQQICDNRELVSLIEDFDDLLQRYEHRAFCSQSRTTDRESARK